jgi:hypothetical protein
MRETPANGNQSGIGVYAYNDSGAARNVTVSKCSIHDYQKGGIVFNGAMTVGTANKNVVTGLGPVSYIAQNGIQFGYGASGIADSNLVGSNIWTGTYGGSNDPISDPDADASAGILAYMSGPSLTIVNNSIIANQFGFAAVAAEALDMHDNSIMGIEHSTYVFPVGIGIWSSDQWTPAGGEAATMADIRNNVIMSNDYGMLICDYVPDGVTPHVTAQLNVLCNNRLFGAWSNVATDAIHNWWGIATGPTTARNAGGLGDIVNDSVNFAPWHLHSNFDLLVVDQALDTTQDSTSVGLLGTGCMVKITSTPDTNNRLVIYTGGLPTDTPITSGETFPSGVTRRATLVWGIVEIGSDTADVTLDYSGFPGIYNPSTLHVIKRGSVDDPWVDVSSRFVNDIVNRKFTATGISNFSEFSIGGGADNPLPVETETNVPKVFTLEQNYPNPFNPMTTIEFTLPEDGFATLKIFNVVGQEIATLVNGFQRAGTPHRISFNASALPSGIYFARLSFDVGGRQQQLIRKMALLK